MTAYQRIQSLKVGDRIILNTYMTDGDRSGQVIKKTSDVPAVWIVEDLHTEPGRRFSVMWFDVKGIGVTEATLVLTRPDKERAR